MRKRTSVVFAAMVLAIAMLAGCSEKNASTATKSGAEKKDAAPAAPQYDTYTAPDGSFSVDVPAGSKVQVSKQDIDTAAGKSAMTTYTVEGKDVAFMVSTIPLNIASPSPETIKEALKRGIEGAAGQGAVSESKEITVGSYPAMQALIATKQGDKDIYIRTVHFFINNTQLQFQVLGYSKERVSQEDAIRFLSSIKPLTK